MNSDFPPSMIIDDFAGLACLHPEAVEAVGDKVRV
jgi:hypothetical protein